MDVFTDICRAVYQQRSVLLIILVIYNFIVCMIYGIDKYRAKARRVRISERTLKLLAIFFGGLGAYVGMTSFRHKTRHTDFRIMVPLCLIAQALLIGVVIFFGA